MAEDRDYHNNSLVNDKCNNNINNKSKTNGKNDEHLHINVNCCKRSSIATQTASNVCNIPTNVTTKLTSRNVSVTTTSITRCVCDTCKKPEYDNIKCLWQQLKYSLLKIYHEDGLTLNEDYLHQYNLKAILSKHTIPTNEHLREIVHKLCVHDIQKLYQCLEAQVRIFVIDMRLNLLKHLQEGSQILFEAVIEQYANLSRASKRSSQFLKELETKHFRKFNLTWEFVNRRLFQSTVYCDPYIKHGLPKLTALTKDPSSLDMYARFLKFEDEMTVISVVWREAQQFFDICEKYAILNKKKTPTKDNEKLNVEWIFEEEHRINQFTKANATSTTPSSKQTKQNDINNSCNFLKKSSFECLNARFVEEQKMLKSGKTMQALNLNKETLAALQEQIVLATYSEWDSLDLKAFTDPLSSYQTVINGKTRRKTSTTHLFESTLLSTDTTNLSSNRKCEIIDVNVLSDTEYEDLEEEEEEDDDDDDNNNNDNDGAHRDENGELSEDEMDDEEEEEEDDDDDEDDDEEDDEDDDDESCSDHSSTTSTSTINNQRGDSGRVCDCCYCEVFGHGMPPVAPTSRNFNEMRERLRLRLSKRKAEKGCERNNVNLVNSNIIKKKQNVEIEDKRDLEELINFINGTDEHANLKSRNARKKKQKQKKHEKQNLERDDQEDKLSKKVDLNKENAQPENKLNEINNLASKNNLNTNKSKTKERRKNNNFHAFTVKSEVNNNSNCIANNFSNQSNKNTTNDTSKNGDIIHNLSKSPVQISTNGLLNVINNKKSDANTKDIHISSERINGEIITRNKKIKDTGKNSNKHKGKKKNGNEEVLSPDEVFLPKDIDLDNGELDEFEKELEAFKRFCYNSRPLERKEKVNVNLKDIVIKKRQNGTIADDCLNFFRK